MKISFENIIENLKTSLKNYETNSKISIKIQNEDNFFYHWFRSSDTVRETLRNAVKKYNELNNNSNDNSFIYFVSDSNYNNYHLNYYSIGIYILISLIIASLIFFLSYFLIKKNSYVEKLIPYECGFEPYEDTRNIFNVQFYLVALLFLIFDLESLYLYPLVVGLSSIKLFNFYIILDFFIELFIGYLIIYKYILKNILEI
jgi:NADH-quinone oxidoreductase subunit A